MKIEIQNISEFVLNICGLQGNVHFLQFFGQPDKKKKKNTDGLAK